MHDQQQSRSRCGARDGAPYLLAGPKARDHEDCLTRL
jgi:hypothetical protein